MKNLMHPLIFIVNIPVFIIRAVHVLVFMIWNFQIPEKYSYRIAKSGEQQKHTYFSQSFLGIFIPRIFAPIDYRVKIMKLPVLDFAHECPNSFLVSQEYYAQQSDQSTRIPGFAHLFYNTPESTKLMFCV